MKIHLRRNSGLAAIALAIFLAAVLVIAGGIIYLIIKLCRHVLPPTGGDGGTNQTSQIEVVAELPPIQLPIPSPGPNQPAFSAANWLIEVQRSTNLVDWQPILVTNANFQFSFDCDTNPPADRAFYRMRYFR